MKTQKIMPSLWVEKDAKKTAQYYLSIFKNGKLKSYQVFKNLPGPGGDTDTATIQILGMDFQILAAGPLFKFNEAVSFVIRCKDQAEVDYDWKALTAKGGSEGPCGWLKDKFISGLLPEAESFPITLKKLIIENDCEFYSLKSYLRTLSGSVGVKWTHSHPHSTRGVAQPG